MATVSAVPIPPTTPSSISTVKITDVRVSNFRSLKNVELALDSLTVLIGSNNAGKTSFLDALYAAIGAGRRVLGVEDVRIEPGESSPPKSRKIVIDVRIRIFSAEGILLDAFPSGSFWTGLWGMGIAQDLSDNLNEFVAIRTTLSWNVGKADYALKREFLREWKPFADWLTAATDKAVTADMVEPIALHYIDAKRDLDDDLRKQGSFWRRMVEDLGLPIAEVNAIEASLLGLNQQIVAGSAVLRHVKTHLADLDRVVSVDSAGIDLAPISPKMRDMAKGVDVNISTGGGQSFPLARHGMGTRSLASLLVFRAFASWKALQANNAGNHIHTLLALEEPEAHLHPQAQRSLFAQVRAIPGQRIVSTHSPYFAGQASLSTLRLFRKQTGETTITQLNLSAVTRDEMRKLEDTVVHTRGDLLFAQGLVFFEGPTEEHSLPVWAEKYWGANIHELGLSFICVRGTDYYPFLWLANSLHIPWYVFADGEPKPLADLEAVLRKLGYGPAASCPNIVVLPNGNNFETQLLADGYINEIELALDIANEEANFLNTYIADHHGEMGKKQIIRDYQSPGGKLRAASDAMKGSKTRLAKPLARTIAQLPDARRRFPPNVEKLFSVISTAQGFTKVAQ